MVKIKGLTKSFGRQRVLKDLTIEFPPGDVTVIAGPSGCGKSTLLRCINFLELFDSGGLTIGELTVDWHAGESPRLSKEKRERIWQMRLKTGMVFQGFNLFPHLTILENVALAPKTVKGWKPAQAEALADSILERVGLGDKRNEYPARLSGGQQQRAAIARSLAMQPEVMLYDEPTSQLDPRLVEEVFAVMRELNQDGMTQIVVTHDARFVREVARRLLVFEDGGACWKPVDDYR